MKGKMCPKVKDVRYTCLSSICPKLFDTRAKRYEALQCTPFSCHAAEAAAATPSPAMAQYFLQLLVLILLILGRKNPAKTRLCIVKLLHIALLFIYSFVCA